MVDQESIKQMMDDHHASLTGPMDDMWEEGIIPGCRFFAIRKDEACGYFALNDENVMLAFYATSGHDHDEMFRHVVNEKNVKKAYVSSNDPLFYGLCMALKKDVADHTFLYRQGTKVEIESPVDGLIRQQAQMDDMEKVIKYFNEKVGLGGDWLVPYVTKIINNGGLYLFRRGDEIIGTGEMRPSISSEGYANIGVTVSEDSRRRGFAGHIICTIREEANRKGYETICSTERDNIASRKTLEKCGYECYHKIYTVTF